MKLTEYIGRLCLAVAVAAGPAIIVWFGWSLVDSTQWIADGLLGVRFDSQPEEVRLRFAGQIEDQIRMGLLAMAAVAGIVTLCWLLVHPISRIGRPGVAMGRFWLWLALLGIGISAVGLLTSLSLWVSSISDLLNYQRKPFLLGVGIVYVLIFYWIATFAFTPAKLRPAVPFAHG